MKARGLRSFPIRWFWLAAVLALHSGSGQAALRQGPLLGKKAPDFHVQGIFNESYSLDTFKGRILVLQFGASW